MVEKQKNNPSNELLGNALLCNDLLSKSVQNNK
jgi:hypothetical protein